MLKTGWTTTVLVVCVFAILLGAGCGKGSPFTASVVAIGFTTQALGPAGAGVLYNQVIVFESQGDAALPDRFELVGGALPPGIQLLRDREDADGDLIPDEDGQFTGHARVIGFPRQQGSFTFTIKAISTGQLNNEPQQPDVAVSLQFTVNVGEGRVAILTPTAEEGSVDPQVPAFPALITFVNPANPQAFFSFPFLIAGGSGDNCLTIMMPREVELSVFDDAISVGADGIPNSGDEALLTDDIDEVLGSGDKFENNFGDGGWFALQAGFEKIQVGGFQSPRGAVGFITAYDPDWFQRAAVPKNSRRDLGDSLGLAGGDTTLGTPAAVLFSDYFDDNYEDTHPSFTPPPGSTLTRRKYAFTSDQYQNAFFVAPNSATPLRYRIIVQAVDKRNNQIKSDDIIDRKAFIVSVEVPPIVIDTVFLPDGQCGIDYNEFIVLSGGVPPLSCELEFIDGDTTDLGDLVDGGVTDGHALTKDLFGMEIHEGDCQFFGVPRADGLVDVTVRAFAAVMSIPQGGAPGAPPPFVPTGGAGEYDGLNPTTGKLGRHKTFQVNFAAPSLPVVANGSLAPGSDGLAYSGDRIVGSGGVPRLVPYPVGFTGDFVNGITPERNYDWTTTYQKDASFPAAERFVGGDPANGAIETPGLPNGMSLVQDATLPTNGQLTGTPTDRGFQLITFNGTDCYVGDATVANVANAQLFSKSLTLSVDPDTAVYTRGRLAAEGPDGETTGLINPTKQMGEARMVPLFSAASLYTVETRAQPQLHTFLPAQFDFLPVMIPNGGTDSHTSKCGPSISGYWPAEADREDRWHYFTTEAWKHVQQQLVWLQSPGADHAKVFLWGETVMEKYDAGGAWELNYGQFGDTDGDGDIERGTLVVHPLTGEWHVPAILTDANPDHGTVFGAEVVVSGNINSFTANSQVYNPPGYWKYYYYSVRDSGIDRRLHMHGQSTYIDEYQTASEFFGTGGWYKTSQGRSATSVAMSDDGAWCATALPGGTNEQKILLWRTDDTPIPAAMLAQGHVMGVEGRRSDGSTYDGSPGNEFRACIIKPGGSFPNGPFFTGQDRLLPDSLKFVRDGLLYLSVGDLDFVNGVSLVDGHLSIVDINFDSTAVNGAGLGPFTNFSKGQFPPDQDFIRGRNGTIGAGAQFAFAGSKPAPGEEGPDHVALVAGDNFVMTHMDAPGPNFGSDPGLPAGNHPRHGYVMAANRNKSLIFIDLNDGDGDGDGLDLNTAVVNDLTGSDPAVYGDLMSPGRYGESHDWLALSDDGKYVAVVRDQNINQSSSSTFSGRRQTFGTGTTSSSKTLAWQVNDDILLMSTDGSEMNAGGGEHVLYIGTAVLTPNAGDPALTGAYAIGKNYLNAGFRRIEGVTFGSDNRTLVFKYQGENNRIHPKHNGSTATGRVPNPETTAGTFADPYLMMSVRLHFRDTAGDPINFGAVGTNMANMLSGLAGIGGIGDATVPFGDVGGNQVFWASFKSCNCDFLYYISDQLSGSTAPQAANRNYMVGFNISAGTIGPHDPWVPFSPHTDQVGFPIFDVNGFNYDNQFAASPPGVQTAAGRDANGILAVIATAAGVPTNATDLDVYVMDTNVGGDMICVTPNVTDGTVNNINHLRMSANGNVLVGQRSKQGGRSRDDRQGLNGESDLFVVTNLHAVLGGALPNDFILNAANSPRSYGASVAFVGETIGNGPLGVVVSAALKGTNQSWDDRTLQLQLLVPDVPSTTLDSNASHYNVLGVGRNDADDEDGPG